MRATIVTPSPRGSRHGNRVTALRWAAVLRHLGARVRIVERWRGEPCDLLVAVHAVKSADSVLAAAAALPALRVVVLLAGTDVYPTFAPSPAALAALQRADAIVALQPFAIEVLPPPLRSKARTIVQSATARPAARPREPFVACVLAHLRPVKDPLLVVRALAAVPRTLPLRVVLAGEARAPELAAAARAAAAAEPRFRWLGPLPRRRALELLAGSHACIVPSAAEGGANVVSEAIAAGTPVLATAVPGNLGLLGSDWPATFAVDDALGLAALLQRAATDADFRTLLAERTRALQPLVAPAREVAAWRRLLADLGLPASV
ncbi:MAG: TIGR04348 family glycosyltransferase [Planctomycetes bacterium]|nr:TIGR04348 family glycosyltransferase [Planctomycetota bacterium]